jgi:glycosyltransferase involved in cell wall biosynthesis
MLSSLLLKQGHHVTFFTTPPSNDSDKSKVDNLDLVYLESDSARLNGKWVTQLRNAFLSTHENRPLDCIFVEGASAWGLHRLFASLSLPVIAFVHNFGLVHFYNVWKEVDNVRSMLYYFSKTVPKIVQRMFIYDIPFLQKSRWVISGSIFNAVLLKRFYRIPKSRLRVIHNWVNSSHFVPAPSVRRETRLRLKIPQDVLTFLLVGSLWRPKGFHIAIQSFCDFLHQYPKARMLIVGTGPYEPQLRRLQDSNYLKEKIEFLGSVPNGELPSIYNSADVFLSPSLISEVLPYVLIEAMSCGLPVIATELSGNKEAVGNAGLLVPLGDVKSLSNAMLFLARKPEKRERLGDFARERVIALFSEEVALKKMSMILKETFNTENGQHQQKGPEG